MGDLRQTRDIPAAWGGPSGPPGRVDKIARASGRLARPADAQPRAWRRASRPLVAAVPRRRRGRMVGGIVQFVDRGHGLVAALSVTALGVVPEEVPSVGIPHLSNRSPCENVWHPGGVVGVIVNDLAKRDIALPAGLEPLRLLLVPLVVADLVDRVR